MVPTMLDRIRNSPRAAELLADVFDFDINRTDPVEPVSLASGGTLSPVAGDASGGTFFVCDEGPVLYASSEGGAGVLATDLSAVLQLITGIPTWHDVVAYAPDVDKMRTAFETSYQELKDDLEPEIEEYQAEVTALLELERDTVDELLTRLSASLTDLSPNYALQNEDGDEYDPL